ncbi:hypothetical protein COL940_013105 [Colletotrichum noveboracense]|nr:hypothetical protein COL940_013105 [Colletotrichum noveboracense]KAJ0273217.1 hypothetical protein CBS470a_012349 [Colletotrichum nupharicola]
MDTTGLRNISTLASAATKRLFWTVNGPRETAIQVAPSQYYEPGDAMEPYFRPAAAAGLEPTWHAVSQASLMEPQIATITIRLEYFNEWEDFWVELHRDCTDTRTDPRRPRAKDVQLELTAGGVFVTIQDYVSAERMLEETARSI